MKHSGLKTAQGVALLEILIALLVTSIGLVGLAGLQVLSLKNNQSAAMQSQANVLAYDMLDRMRANATRIETGAISYNIGLEDAAPTGTSTIKDRDIKQWRDLVKATLPEGTGAIACAGRVCRVRVQWKDASPFDESGSETRTIDLVSSL